MYARLLSGLKATSAGCRRLPTLITLTLLLAAVLITDTLLPPLFATYTREPATATSCGADPTLTVEMNLFVAVLITETPPPPRSVR